MAIEYTYTPTGQLENSKIVHDRIRELPQTLIDMKLNKNLKSSQPSTQKVWDEKRGKEVYLTWHINEKTVLTAPSPSFIDYNSRARRRSNGSGYLRSECKGLVYLEQDRFGDSFLAVYRDLMSQDNDYSDSELLTMAKAAANRATFDLGTFLGEMPETIRFAGTLVVKIIQSIHGLKPRRIRPPETQRVYKKGYRTRERLTEFSDGAELSADGWLAYRYAVLPLVYSLQDALKALDPPTAVFQRDRIRSNLEETSEDVRRSAFGPTPISIISSGSVYDVARCQAYTMLSASDVKKKRVLLDTATTAWELVPLSFVFDWVVQVGTFLTALQVQPCQSQGFTISHKRKIFIETQYMTPHGIQLEYDAGGGYNLIVSSAMQVGKPLTFNSVSYKRTVVDFNVPVIPVATRLSFARVVDAFALVFNGQKKSLYKGT